MQTRYLIIDAGSNSHRLILKRTNEHYILIKGWQGPEGMPMPEQRIASIL